jgi:hypothetical protein
MTNPRSSRSLVGSLLLAAGNFTRAGEGSRTPDLLFTRQVLYQLSYSGMRGIVPSRCVGDGGILLVRCG